MKNILSIFTTLTLIFFVSCSNNETQYVIDGDFDKENETEYDHDFENGDEDVDSETEYDSSDLDQEEEIQSQKTVVGDFPELDMSLCLIENELNLQDFDENYTRVSSGSYLQDKTFYLFTLMQNVQKITEILSTNDLISTISTFKNQDFRDSPNICLSDKNCYKNAIMLSDSEIQNISDQLVNLFADTDSTLLLDHMKKSGVFHLFIELENQLYLKSSFEMSISELNDIVSSYINKLDATEIAEIITKIDTDNTQEMLFFEPSLFSAMAFMLQDERDEAARYEPMELGENATAIEYISHINWKDYPFTVILSPGIGAKNLEQPLTEGGAEHCDLAAERYHAGVAPLIAVSGGHVHPDRTPYAEAIEMKKYLIETHNVPENAIIIDPHARHTPTNLRNVGRLIFRYGIPADKPYLCTTDMFQSLLILNFEARCLDELGYVPHRNIVRLKDTDNCILPSPTVLHIAPSDPLDP